MAEAEIELSSTNSQTDALLRHHASSLVVSRKHGNGSEVGRTEYKVALRLLNLLAVWLWLCDNPYETQFSYL